MGAPVARFFFKHKGCPNRKRGGYAVEVSTEGRGTRDIHSAAHRAADSLPCPDCGARPRAYYTQAPKTGGPTFVPRLMGRVDMHTRSLFVLQGACPCDARCTGATGPNCDCSCSGANHGSHAVIWSEVKNGTLAAAVAGQQEAAR